MYSIIKRLGYSHCDAKGNVSLFSLLNILQDIGGYFCEDAGIGETYLREHDLGWIVYNWNINIIKEPNIYDSSSLNVGTMVYECKGAVSNRYYEVRDKFGELLIEAYATWVLIKYSTGHPNRLTNEIKAVIIQDGEEKYIEYKIEKCLLPHGLSCEKMIEGRVKKSYIDIRGHMNNARYLEYSQELLKENLISKIYINYQIPLFYQEKFIIKKYILNKKEYLEFCVRDSEDGKEKTACVIRVEYLEEKEKKYEADEVQYRDSVGE